jgi:hypothetical protein
MTDMQRLESALAFGISMIASEHFISAGLSSPWSVAKFAKCQKDKRQVWQLFAEAGAASLVSAAIIGWLLEDPIVFLWSMLGAISVMIFVASEYWRALSGTL